MKKIGFYTSDGRFTLKKKKIFNEWLINSAAAEGAFISRLQINFCTDSYLLEINKKYLGHKTLTDIITFPYKETKDGLEGELFISFERIRENAEKFKSSFEPELARVMIHGLLHLLGYKDKTKEEKMVMREKEEEYLNKLVLE